ncbi:MAG: hypothetical protein LUF33_06765 [Clostridiales bacterium]|nr:hypothetical protein [Clostridiales bacterium]
MDKLLFKRILIALITLLAVIYVAYLLISANFDMYPTENAIETTVTDKIYTNAFIIRDETYITNDSSGVLTYTVDDGEQVNADGEIAKIYSNESDATAQTKADMFEEQMESLQNLQDTDLTNSVGIDTINTDISNEIISLLSDLNNGEISSADDNINNLVYSINQRQAYTGKISSFEAEISDLQSQIDELRSSSSESIGTIKTSEAGYFSANCDGFENVFDYSDVSSLTLSEFNSFTQSEVSDNVAGKIISSLNWFIACEITSDQATDLTLWDNDVTVMFSDASTESVPASVYTINQSSDDENALLILECNYMDADLAEARQEPIEIGLATYTGLRVSKKAIHDDYVENVTYDDDGNKSVEKKKVQGVYVLYGSEVQFKEISIIYSGSDYVICDPEPDSGVLFNGETVSLYDQVILEGDDLYDGKVIE